MNRWEDIVKDKMEEFNEPLPENVFTEFKALRTGAMPASAKKRFPVVWAIVPAVAAGLAAILLLRQPAVPEDGIQVIQQPSTPVSIVPDSTGSLIPMKDESLIVQALTPKVLQQPAILPQKAEIDDNSAQKEVTPTVPVEEAVTPETRNDTIPDSQNEKRPDILIQANSSPYIPSGIIVKPKKKIITPIMGLAMGGGLTAAVMIPMQSKTYLVNALGYDGPELNEDRHLITNTHYLPIKVGLSASFAISERLNLTTGLEYSLDKSRFTIPRHPYGEQTQYAHYLGIPVRLDYTLFSYHGFDLYLGGGVEGDVCLKASRAGNIIKKKDGWCYSLLGASGIQYHITEGIGVFVEPEITWSIPSDNRVLETYRTNHPLMFSVSSGLRLYF